MRAKVETDSRAAERMLTNLGNAAHEQKPVMARMAQDTAKRITGIPVDTGALEQSVGVLLAEAHGFVVGTKGVPYARYVFRGTRYVSAQPPKVPSDVGARTAHAVGSNLMHAARR